MERGHWDGGVIMFGGSYGSLDREWKQHKQGKHLKYPGIDFPSEFCNTCIFSFQSGAIMYPLPAKQGRRSWLFKEHTLGQIFKTKLRIFF